MQPRDFLAFFPEFTATNAAVISAWLAIASQQVNPQRWGALTNYGIALLTAHYLTVAANNSTAAAVGAPVGGVTGPETSKSVDGVSVSQDVASVTVAGGGNYNASTYGVMFLQQAQLMGAGGLQINAY